MNIYDIEQNSHYFYISQCYTTNKNEKKSQRHIHNKDYNLLACLFFQN